MQQKIKPCYVYESEYCLWLTLLSTGVHWGQRCKIDSVLLCDDIPDHYIIISIVNTQFLMQAFNFPSD